MPGYFLVGSGSTGVAGSLLVLAALYTSIIGESTYVLSHLIFPTGASALTIRRPPMGYTVGEQVSANPLTAKAVPPSAVMATPQYWLLFSTASLLATGGMALMSVASPMMQEVFSPSLPHLVTPATASAYLMYALLGKLQPKY